MILKGLFSLGERVTGDKEVTVGCFWSHSPPPPPNHPLTNGGILGIYLGDPSRLLEGFLADDVHDVLRCHWPIEIDRVTF